MPEQTDPTLPIPADLVTELANDLRVAKQELAFVVAALIELEMTAAAGELVLARFGGLGEEMSERDYLAKLLERAHLAARIAFNATGGTRAEVEAAINERYDAARAQRLLALLKAVPPGALPEA